MNAGELFKARAGIDLNNVPFRGSAPMLTAIFSGHVQIAFDSELACIEYIKSNMLRAIAVTGTTRSRVLPDVPTVGEFVPEFETPAPPAAGAKPPA